jgi:hypothetical protein
MGEAACNCVAHLVESRQAGTAKERLERFKAVAWIQSRHCGSEIDSAVLAARTLDLLIFITTSTTYIRNQEVLQHNTLGMQSVLYSHTAMQQTTLSQNLQ